MKRFLFITLTLVISLQGYSQYFNHQVHNYYYDGEDAQSITKNCFHEIVFLSVNQRSPNYLGILNW